MHGNKHAVCFYFQALQHHKNHSSLPGQTLLFSYFLCCCNEYKFSVNVYITRILDIDFMTTNSLAGACTVLDKK